MRMRGTLFSALHLVRECILFAFNSAAIICSHILKAAQFCSTFFHSLIFHYSRRRLFPLFKMSTFVIIRKADFSHYSKIRLFGEVPFSHYLEKLN